MTPPNNLEAFRRNAFSLFCVGFFPVTTPIPPSNLSCDVKNPCDSETFKMCNVATEQFVYSTGRFRVVNVNGGPGVLSSHHRQLEWIWHLKYFTSRILYIYNTRSPWFLKQIKIPVAMTLVLFRWHILLSRLPDALTTSSLKAETSQACTSSQAQLSACSRLFLTLSVAAYCLDSVQVSQDSNQLRGDDARAHLARKWAASKVEAAPSILLLGACHPVGVCLNVASELGP